MLSSDLGRTPGTGNPQREECKTSEPKSGRTQRCLSRRKRSLVAKPTSSHWFWICAPPRWILFALSRIHAYLLHQRIIQWYIFSYNYFLSVRDRCFNVNISRRLYTKFEGKHIELSSTVKECFKSLLVINPNLFALVNNGGIILNDTVEEYLFISCFVGTFLYRWKYWVFKLIFKLLRTLFLSSL